MVQSIELLLDADTDAAVRAEWARLHDVGLPSPATNQAETNRPHVTLWAGDMVTASVEDALGELEPVFPIAVRLGSLTCFGRRRFILVRQVVANAALLRFQQRITELCGVERGSLLAPGRWSPHVTLARRLSAVQVGAAIDALGGSHERDAQAVGWRRWDGDDGREWRLRSAR